MPRKNLAPLKTEDEVSNGKPGRTANYVKQQEFILAFVKHRGNKAAAAREIGIQPDTAWEWFKRDAKFRKQVDLRLEEFYDGLWARLMDRATEKSDTAAMFLLKERYPERFDDNIRKAKWLLDKGVDDPERAAPMQIVFVREPKKDDAILVNGTNGHAPLLNGDSETQQEEN